MFIAHWDMVLVNPRLGRSQKTPENVSQNAPTTFKVLINGHTLNPGGVT
jgi:hypothetical protein